MHTTPSIWLVLSLPTPPAVTGNAEADADADAELFNPPVAVINDSDTVLFMGADTVVVQGTV